MGNTARTRTRPEPKTGESQSRAALVRSLDVEKRTIDVVASTDAVDSHGTVLVQDWSLERFNANPVILWAHNATLGMDELPIGKATRAEVVNGQLEATIQFAGADVNPRAEQVFQAYRQGFLRAVSVGFCPRSYRWEMRDGEEVLVFYDNELLEISCVPIGSNPDALARALARSHTGPEAPATETDTMTEEEKALLALARRALEMLGEKDPAAAEARIRGLLDVREQAEKAGEELAKTRKALAATRAAEVIAGAIRDAKLPPRSEWTDEQRAYIEALSAEVPAGQTRSPLEAYVATLTRRVPTPEERKEPKSPNGGPAQRSAPAQPPTYARQVSTSYQERAQSEKAARRAKGFAGSRVTDTPAPEGD